MQRISGSLSQCAAIKLQPVLPTTVHGLQSIAGRFAGGLQAETHDSLH